MLIYHPPLQTVTQPHAPSTTVVGQLGNSTVSPTSTDPTAKQLAERNEAPQGGGGLLSRILTVISRPFEAVRQWIANLLGHTTPQTQSASPADPIMSQVALEATLRSLNKAAHLADINAENLQNKHAELANNDGTLRSLTTALYAVKKHSQNASISSAAAALLDTKVEGIAFQQWGTTDMDATKWLRDATPEQLTEAAKQLNQLQSGISQLAQAVSQELKGEPAEQYLNKPKVDGPSSVFGKVDANKAVVDTLLKPFQTQPASTEQTPLTQRETAPKESVIALAKADDQLADINATNLHEFASASGPLRSLVTALNDVKRYSLSNDCRLLAAELLDKKIEGIAFQQWGTIDGEVSDWLSKATPRQLIEASQQLYQLAPPISLLYMAIERYPDRPSNGQTPAFSDSETLAIRIYTAHASYALNNSLRTGKD